MSLLSQGDSTDRRPANAPVFSVVIPTRNRPVLFRAALDSVLEQKRTAFEVIVINDGSTGDCLSDYAAIERELGQGTGFPVKYIHLEHLPKGHGQSQALNIGARHAAGRYLCFLDDDDTWTDDSLLARAQAALAATDEERVDAIFFNQAAYRGEELVTQPIWLEDLGQRLLSERKPDAGAAYAVTPETLLTATGFPHVNVTIVSASLFSRIGGFNQGLFYECDRDFYLRAIDAASLILYIPATVARHNVPDPSKNVNMSTRAKPLEKHMCQFILLNHALHTAHSKAIQAHARAHRRFALSKALKNSSSASDYGRIATIVMRSMAHELGNQLRGARVLPAGPHGV